jgi:hypothetical protein
VKHLVQDQEGVDAVKHDQEVTPETRVLKRDLFIFNLNAKNIYVDWSMQKIQSKGSLMLFPLNYAQGVHGVVKGLL